MSQLSFLDGEAAETISWTPTRAAGLARLEAFAPRAGRAYASARNYDYGPERRSNVSALSPWIRHRLILEEEVLAAALARHSAAAADKLVQEVFWRAYFKGWLEQRPSVWERYCAQTRAAIARLERDAPLAADYEAAVEGRTGVDAFDAWAAELVETGYLHNHARMWFASIWIFTLKLPWVLGADFFYRHLLDGDPASNTLSWRWVAGLHTKGKTYLARARNIHKYTDGRFHPDGDLALAAPPLGEDAEDSLVSLAPAPGAPEAGSAFGLLVLEDDCAPELLGHSQAPAAILGLSDCAARSPLPVGAPAAAFARGALADALARAEAAFGVGAEQQETAAWGGAIADWAARRGLKRVVVAAPPVGPAAERLAQAAPALGAAGIDLVRLRRPYDGRAWPHATKGFFGLKKKIPELLQQCGLR